MVNLIYVGRNLESSIKARRDDLHHESSCLGWCYNGRTLPPRWHCSPGGSLALNGGFRIFWVRYSKILGLLEGKPKAETLPSCLCLGWHCSQRYKSGNEREEEGKGERKGEREGWKGEKNESCLCCYMINDISEKNKWHVYRSFLDNSFSVFSFCLYRGFLGTPWASWEKQWVTFLISSKILCDWILWIFVLLLC